MKPMGDKEIDRIFRDRFAEAEIEPPVNLWRAVIAKRIAPEKRRWTPVFWIAAASVSAFFTTLFFIYKEPTIYLRANKKYTMIEKKSSPLKNYASTKILPERNKIFLQTYNEADIEKFKASLIKDKGNLQEAISLKKNLATLQLSGQIARLSFQETAIKPLTLPKHEANAETRKLFAKVNTGSDNEANKLGKIVNFVIDKLDKRDKKLIAFGSDNDGGITIIGINLGFIQWNKPQKQHTLLEVDI